MKRIKILGMLLALSVSMTGAAAELPPAWQGAVAKMIASRQTYPRSAQIRGEQGTTKLRITLAPDGKIGQTELTQSSGSAILDREAQSLISGIGKFPAPPAGINSLVIPIVWRLN